MTGHPGPGAWAAAMTRLHDQAAGILNVEAVRQSDAPRLVLAAAAGDPDAARLLAVVDALRGIEDAPAHAPMQCGACGGPVRPRRFAICIAWPVTLDPMQGLGMAVCARCGTTPGAILAAATRALRLFWPDARPIQVHPTGGRA